MAAYDSIPADATLKPTRFTVSVPDDDLQHFHDLLKLSKIGPKTYESLQTDTNLGVSYDWISEAKKYWEANYDWRAREEYINSFPNFTAQIKDDDGEEYTMHFVALFSQKKDAIPILFMHGWPGSFLEFLGLLSVFKQKYSPEDLPYHLIVPSMPGTAFSYTPPLQRDWSLEDSARTLHYLMIGLGFGSGYVVQGGDIGSYTSRIMVAKYQACKAMHLNFCIMRKPEGVKGELDLSEQESVAKADLFGKTGNAYALEQGTRTATIGFVLSSSPLALLAWVGEKFLEWTDVTPPLEEILDAVSLYWFTESFPRCIYPYRQSFKKGPERYMLHMDPQYKCTKPFGYSSFPKEIAAIPKSWVETTGNMVWFKRHSEGGHFAAMEKPEVIADDIEDFLRQIWPVR